MQTAKTMRRMKEATKKAAAVSFSAILAFSLMVPSLSFADDPADGQAAQDAVMAIADAQQSAQGSASTADKADTASDVDAGDAQGSDGASSIVDDSGLSAEQDANKANGTDVASSTDGANKDDKDDQSAESTIDSTDTDGKAGQDAGATQGTAVAPSTNAPGNVLGVDPTADVDPSLYPSEEETAESAIAPLSVDVDDPAQERVLVENRFTGINPKNTTVNLYDYTSAPGSAPGSDEVNSGTAAQWLSPSTPNINAGHALTFGNGMSQDMGYWNAGSGSGQGDFSKQNPGFQNIVQPKLVDGYPALSTDSMNVSGYSDVDNDGVVGTFNTWPLVGGYNSNPPLYAKARRVNAQWSNGQLVFGNAGGKNISDTVQNQWNKDTSLAYLFDTSDAAASAPGRTATHSDVKGLFQLDDHGYYYYNMRKNFAEYTAEEVQGRDGTIPANSFILYDEPAGLRTDGTGSVGNFFPFNTGEQVFKVEDGKLVNDIYASNNGAAGSASNQGQNKPMINHNLGMTMTTSFRQPVNGNVGSNPMTFEFIGDDDLWIFIDDVLVLDLGGIHSELYGTIDFSTGEVNLGTAYTANGDISAAPAPVRTTTIKDMFDAAGVDTSTGFRDNTFASNTSHTLKMFYFERGNYDSSLSVRFNLQPELYQQIKKVDQDGNPVAGAEFGLYPVDSTTASSAEGATLDNVTYDATATPLTTVTTGQDGTAQFMQGNQPFNFADRVKADDVASQLFILRESTAPPGYRMMPIDILMRYDRETGTFVVNNRYDTGSYASFNSYVTQISSDGLRYGRYDEATQTIVSTDAPVSKSQQRNGLVVGIPTLQQPSSTRWEPVYGSNNSKLNVVSDQDANLDSMRNAMLEAVLHQAYLNQNDASVPGWYMVWDDEEGRLASYYEVQDETGASHVVSTLSDLPGNPTRYRLSNPDGDMMMVYGVVSSEVFGPNASGMTAQQKYAALANRVKSKLGNVENPTEEQIEAAVKAAAADVAAVQTPDATGDFANRGFSAIEASPSVFVRDFRTVVNIPNEQRELRVWKVDQNESRVNGAVFGLFDSKAEAENAVRADVEDDVVTHVYDVDGNEIAPYAAGVTGDLRGADTKYQGDDIEGMLVFAPYVENGPGGAHTLWTQGDDAQSGRVLYMKEVQAPAGFNPNDTVIPVVIGQYGIYADAGNAADGIDVLAGVGKLASTMTKYAASPDFNLTLRYIVSMLEQQDSSVVPDGAQSVNFDTFNAAWQSNPDRTMHLEYGVNALVDYGSPEDFTYEQMVEGVGYIDAAGNQRPLFRTTTGFIRTAVEQDTEAVQKAMTEGEHAGVLADLLPDSNLTNLFMIRNTVRVTDVKRPNPEVAKLDQNGNPVAGVEFELYAVNAPAGTTDANLAEVTLESAEAGKSADPVARMTTDSNGLSLFYGLNADGTDTHEVIDFARRAATMGMNGGRLYILHETKQPSGYRPMATDLVVRYDPTTGMLAVNNRYETGASASFASFVTVDKPLYYTTYDNGALTTTSDAVDQNAQQNGIVVAVPTIKDQSNWLPMYGDVQSGYQTVEANDTAALLEAALRQASGSGHSWHLSWTSSIESLTGHIEGLPGHATDYRLVNPEGKLQMVYAVVSPEALDALGVHGITTEELYAGLGKAVQEQGLDKVLAAINGTPNGFRTIDAGEFERSFQPVIYVPNEQRELRLWKLDEEGNRVDGAVFALFDERADAERAADAKVEDAKVVEVTDASGTQIATAAAGVTGVPSNGDKADNQHGTIVFAPYVENGEGTANTVWIDEDGSDLTGKVLYLKEVKAPEGYEVNETIIPIVIGKLGVYADAGTEDDGVDVLAGVGKLAVPMTKFASSPNIDITLRYIVSHAQEQPSLRFNADGSLDDQRVDGTNLDFDLFNDDWLENGKAMDLVYGDESALVSYGHPGDFTAEQLAQGIGYPDAYGDYRPLFRASTGFIRTGVTQNTEAMLEARGTAENEADLVSADDLSGQDLTGLFTIRNTVRVVDAKTPDTPDKPEVPDNPDDPNKPVVPDNPDNPVNPDDPDSPDDPASPDVPNGSGDPDSPGVDTGLGEPSDEPGNGLAKTGDAAPIVALVVLVVAAAIALVIGVIRRKG